MKILAFLLLFPSTLLLAQAQDAAPLKQEITSNIQGIKEREVALQDLSKLPLAAWSTEAIQNKARQGDPEACILMSRYWQNNAGEEEGNIDQKKLAPFLDGRERPQPLTNDANQWMKYWLERAIETNDPIARLYEITVEINKDNPNGIGNNDSLIKEAEAIAIPLALKGHPRALEFLFFKGSEKNPACMKAIQKGLQLLKEDSLQDKLNAAADYYILISAFSSEGDNLPEQKQKLVKDLLPDAIKHLRAAAKKEDPSAMYILVDAINIEEIPAESPIEHIQLLERGSALNDVRAIHQLSMMTSDEVVTKECYTKLAELGDARSLAYEASDLIAKGEGMKALPLLERALAFGESYVMDELSNLYEGTAGVPANPEKAFELAKKMVDQHSAAGMLRLARFYEKGIGCKADPAKAHELLQWAALSNLPASHVALARSYLLGIGCAKDEKKAYNFLSALYMFNPETFGVTFLLGYCNEEGLGTKMDLQQAMKFYQEGVSIEDPKAMNNLATMYRIGSVGKPNLEEASRLYTLAAKLGNTDAQKNLEALSSIKRK